MFESAELGHEVDKRTYDRLVPGLRSELLDAQRELLDTKKFPVILLVSGVEAAGKGELVHLLNDWMDPRSIDAHAFGAPDCREIARPRMWRYWQALPPAGRIGIFFGAWYADPINARFSGHMKRTAFEHRLDEIHRFETMLTDEGALVLKVWLHLSKKAQLERIHELSKNKETRWHVTGADWTQQRRYKRFREVAEEALRRTSTSDAPWLVVESRDERYRNLTVGRVLADALRARLDEPAHHVHRQAPPMMPAADNRALLRSLDLTKSLDKKEYDERLRDGQARLNLLSRKLFKSKASIVVAFEGSDAAGKGGAIKRITQALDARQFRITSIAAPNEEEKAHPYLWRFWRHVPGRGTIAIFDRTWYGRVLVERVEELTPEVDWMRAYSEIRDFEEQLVTSGTQVVKYWLAISKEEQLRRFKQRAKLEFKRYKITTEDWRNRKKWDAYEQAACDMIDRTSTSLAPWVLVEAEDKHYARVKIVETLCERFAAALG